MRPCTPSASKQAPQLHSLASVHRGTSAFRGPRGSKPARRRGAPGRRPEAPPTSDGKVKRPWCRPTDCDRVGYRPMYAQIAAASGAPAARRAVRYV